MRTAYVFRISARSSVLAAAPDAKLLRKLAPALPRSSPNSRARGRAYTWTIVPHWLMRIARDVPFSPHGHDLELRTSAPDFGRDLHFGRPDRSSCRSSLLVASQRGGARPTGQCDAPAGRRGGGPDAATAGERRRSGRRSAVGRSRSCAPLRVQLPPLQRNSQIERTKSQQLLEGIGIRIRIGLRTPAG